MHLAGRILAFARKFVHKINGIVGGAIQRVGIFAVGRGINVVIGIELVLVPPQIFFGAVERHVFQVQFGIKPHGGVRTAHENASAQQNDRRHRPKSRPNAYRRQRKGGLCAALIAAVVICVFGVPIGRALVGRRLVCLRLDLGVDGQKRHLVVVFFLLYHKTTELQTFSHDFRKEMCKAYPFCRPAIVLKPRGAHRAGIAFQQHGHGVFIGAHKGNIPKIAAVAVDGIFHQPHIDLGMQFAFAAKPF